MDDHPIMQSRDSLTAGADTQPGDYCMYEACKGGGEERKTESESMALMLQIRFPNGSRVLEE
jgi:hypothetical protein